MNKKNWNKETKKIRKEGYREKRKKERKEGKMVVTNLRKGYDRKGEEKKWGFVNIREIYRHQVYQMLLSLEYVITVSHSVSQSLCHSHSLSCIDSIKELS